jgi:hypothetical protein
MSSEDGYEGLLMVVVRGKKRRWPWFMGVFIPMPRSHLKYRIKYYEHTYTSIYVCAALYKSTHFDYRSPSFYPTILGFYLKTEIWRISLGVLMGLVIRSYQAK